MSRDFGTVRSALWGSKKFLRVKGDAERLFYLYLHTCPHGNSIGCFRLPKGYAMEDLRWSIETVDRAIEALCKADLIGWDEAECVVRIVSFLEKSPLTNPKHASGAIKAALSLPDCDQKLFICRELAGFAYARNDAALNTYIKSADSEPIGLSEGSSTETSTETETETLPPTPLTGDEPEKPDVPEGGEKDAEQEPPKRKRRSPRVSLPDDFPDAGARAAAERYWRENGRPELVDRMDLQAEKFRAHHAARDSLFAKWPDAWRTWYVNAVEFAGGPVASKTGTGSAPPNWAALCTLAKAKPDAWDREKYGPRPGEAGCRAPAEAQRAAGFAPTGESAPEPARQPQTARAEASAEHQPPPESAPSLFRQLSDPATGQAA